MPLYETFIYPVLTETVYYGNYEFIVHQSSWTLVAIQTFPLETIQKKEILNE